MQNKVWKNSFLRPSSPVTRQIVISLVLVVEVSNLITYKRFSRRLKVFYIVKLFSFVLIFEFPRK